LVLFSSGSTGEPKAVVHDLAALLSRFKAERHTQRIISFLLFDHIGGFNTLMYTLSNHGCIVALEARDPETVCCAIARHRVEVLPTSPTFLNLLLMSGALERYDLSGLRLIDYATEVMPQATLDRLSQALPAVAFHQSYGLSEIGIMRTKSRASRSLWLSLDDATQTRVVDGMLQVKTPTTMLGYLNAPSPFTDDGWFATQDEVEVDGRWLRIKGRKTDIINVGGEKVYPAEVESVIMEVDNIADVTVMSEPHPFTGHIVVAEVTVGSDEDLKKVIRRVRAHCFKKLAPFKVPVKVTWADRERITERFKKERRTMLCP
jgi:long-chain acyl-CoA synthetase